MLTSMNVINSKSVVLFKNYLDFVTKLSYLISYIYLYIFLNVNMEVLLLYYII